MIRNRVRFRKRFTLLWGRIGEKENKPFSCKQVKKKAGLVPTVKERPRNRPFPMTDTQGGNRAVFLFPLCSASAADSFTAGLSVCLPALPAVSRPAKPILAPRHTHRCRHTLCLSTRNERRKIERTNRQTKTSLSAKRTNKARSRKKTVLDDQNTTRG